MLIASDNWQRSICFSEKFSRSIIITEHFRALDQCYLDPGMASMLVTFLYIIWCSGLNPEVLAAEGNGANGVNGGAELPRTKGQNDDTITEGDIVVSKHVYLTMCGMSKTGGRSALSQLFSVVLS
ncbi:hypothetical protein Y032_0038g3640 [Ancylostoma ceylanicum]|uniref:Uncharacterized protein n=1 Tax=Ancylostoma ceylanicum TaxID=53326 RepID=A0A016UJW4_9BILA|nr:hypothetical protein Y032_0038g3640 [Ancylostoma ceylanicum]